MRAFSYSVADAVDRPVRLRNLAWYAIALGCSVALALWLAAGGGP